MVAYEDRSRDRGARFLIIAASLIVVVAGLRAAGQLLLPFLVSVFLAIISLPLMEWLKRWRVPIALAVLLTVLTNIAILVGLLVVVGQSLNEFTAAAPGYQARLQELMAEPLSWLQERGVTTEEYGEMDLINPGALVDLVGAALRAVATIAQNTFLVILTMIFILFEATGFTKKLRMAFGNRLQNVERFGVMVSQIQRYLAIKTLISVATGICVGLWVSLPVLFALVQFGPGHAAVVAMGYLVINVVFANFLEPYLMGRKLGLSTLVVFLSLVFWGWVWGPVGMLLSVPLTVIIKIALENTEDFRWLAVMLGASPRGSVPRVFRR